MLALSFVSPSFGRSIFKPQQDDKVIATEKWGRLEELADGIWAHIATPFETQDFTTVSNGGIIMGKDRVLAIEAFMQPTGAKWMAEQAKKLTGRWPTDVVVTHFHGDHASGHGGYITDEHSPNIWLTESTQTAAEDSFSKIEENAPPEFANVQTLSADEPSVIDLGGRTVTIVPRQGHTNSDVSIEITDPKVIWTGDLFFNRMFPNYGNALPVKLNEYAAELVKMEADTIIVPGHGPLANSEAAKIYVDFLGYVQSEAEKAIKAGADLDAAAGEFKLPERLNDWMVWSPQNAQRAFAAWKRVSDEQE
jgi:glyoxylase-like metal-dependent hydrolase (beta-lactamase superfamily II)